MKNILVYTALPLNNATSVLHNDLLDVLRMTSKYANITFLCTSKKIRKYYEENLDINNIKYISEKPLLNLKDGSNIFKHTRKYLDLLDEKYDSFLTWGLLSYTLNQTKKLLNTLHNDDQYKVTFMSTLMHIYPFVIVDDILNKYDGIHMYCKVTDYNEPDMHQLYDNATMLGLYDDATKGYKKIHDTEYCNFKDGFKDATKTQDFVFGYTVTFAARKYLSDFVVKNITENDKVKLFLKDNYWKDGKRDNLIPHEEYNSELAKSKFTLIAPSTVVTEFSLERFNEAIIRKCLPIFMKEVKYEHVFDKDVCDFIKDNLTYDESYDSIEDFIKKHDYSKLCTKLYSLKSIKQHLDPKMLERQVLEEIGL